MVGVVCLVVIISMAAETSVGSVIVISVMAGCTIVSDGCMRTIQLVIIIMYIEFSRHPVWLCCVAGSAICGQAQVVVIRIGCQIIIISMA